MVEAATTTRRKGASDGTSLPGPLVLRICGSHREGQTIRLRSTKCTIGSGEHCTLRIRARGVQPLHCILIRKAARTVVRRWAADTLLNGAAFTDATLSVGDRLAIGPIEFEVLESGMAPSPGTSRDRALSAGISGGVGKGDSVVEQLQAAKDLARKRTGKILHRLREANRRIEELTAELGGYTSSGGCEDDVQAETDPAAAPGAFQMEQSLLEAAKLLHEEKAELAAAQQRWRGDQERFEAERQTQQAEMERRASETESARAELSALRDAVVKERKSIETDKVRYEQFAAVIERQRGEVERQSEAVARELADVARQREELVRVRDELDKLRESLTADQGILDRQRQEQERLAADRDMRHIQTSHQAEAACAQRAELERQREELTGQREQLKAERKALAEQREAFDAQRKKHEQLLADGDSRRAEAARLSERLDAEREALEREREQHRQLAADLERQQAELRRQSTAAVQEAAELRAQRAAFVEEQQKWEVAETHARKQIEQRAEQLDRQKEGLDEQKRVIAAAREDWEALKSEAEARLAERAEQLDERERELDERTTRLERAPRQSASELSPAVALEFLDTAEEPDEPPRSINSLDLFKQMTAASPGKTVPLSDFPELKKLMREDHSEAERAESRTATETREEEQEECMPPTVCEILLADPVVADSFVPRGTEEPSPKSPTRRKPVGEDQPEESIEEYMAGLLARVNGGSSACGPSAPVERNVGPRPTGTPESSERADCTDNEESPARPSEVSRPRPVVETAARAVPKRPRARAPERAEDLVTLRELANLSAQSALDTHARSRLRKSVNAKLAVVAVALVTAAILFFRWRIAPGSNMYYYMGLAVVLIALLWGVQYAVLAGYTYLTGGRRASRENKPDEPEKLELQPEGAGKNSIGQANQVDEVRTEAPAGNPDGERASAG